MATEISAPAAPARSVLSHLSAGTLQVAVGLFQTIIGMMILVSPHQLASPAYAALQEHLQPWGLAYLVFGSMMIATALLPLPRAFEVAAHLLSGSALVMVAYGLSVVGGWTGTTSFGVLGLGTALAPLLGLSSRSLEGSAAQEAPRGDLLAAIMGVGAFLTGVFILALPGQFTAAIYDVIRPYLPLLGVAFLISGVLLAGVQMRVALPRWAFLGSHLLAAATLITFCLISSVPLRAWMGMAYYGGFGVLVALLPWLHRRLYLADPSSLGVRVALVLAAISVAPLLAVTTFTLARQENATAAAALSQQQTIAASMAQNFSDYLSLHRAAIATLAAQPGLLQASASDQQRMMRTILPAYPVVFLMATYDASGNQIARSDDNRLMSSVRTPLMEELFRTRQPAVVAEISSTTGRPIVGIAVPVPGESGEIRGAVAAGVDASRIEEMLSRGQSSSETLVYLVNARGQVVAHPYGTTIPSFSDLSGSPPVAALLGDGDGSGAIQYGQGAASWLSGYARVQGIGWGVVVERPLAAAMVSTRDERDLAFLAMLLVAAAAATVGFVATHHMVKPITELVSGVGEMAAGKREIRLPASGVSEVRALSGAVGRLRDDLSATETERERLLEAERTARVSAEAAVRARDEFFSVAAHELKTPVTSLQGFAQLLVRQYENSGTMDPERVARAMEQIGRQSGRLGKLTERLLDLSRIEAGKLALAPEEADLTALVRDSVDSAGHSHPDRSIEFDDGKTVKAFIDPLRLQQVVINLIENAVKFSPQEAPIVVEAFEDEEKWITIAVRDRGIGIPEDKQEQIFQRFFQAHPERHYGGMGIGLYVSRQIVEMHGGSIAVEQPEDGGSCFVVRLPRRPNGKSHDD